MPNQLLLLTERFCSLLPLEWALLFKMIQTTWKDSPSPGTESRLSIMPSSGLLRRWHAALRWRAGGHSVSWQELAAQAPWRHVSHHHWKSADRQTAGMLRWRSRGGGEERERGNIWCLQILLCSLLCSQGNSPNTRPTPTCTGGPQQHSNATRQYVIFNNHCIVRFGFGQNAEKNGEFLWCSSGKKIECKSYIYFRTHKT